MADERSFTRAAQRLFITQPALSRAVRDLERETGLQLFDRSGRQVQLTEDGERLVARARRAIAAFDDAVSDIQALTNSLRGVLRLGVSVDTWPYVRGALQALQKSHPELRLELSAGLDRPLSQRVDRRELDAAILWWPDVDAEYESRVLCTVPSPLVTPSGSPTDRRLAEAGRHVAGVLDGTSVVLFDRQLAPATHDGVLGILASLGDVAIVSAPVIAGGVEGAQAAMVRLAAETGMATAVTPHFAQHGGPSVAVHRGVLGDARITMVHNARSRALALALRAHLANAGVGVDG